MNQRNETPAQRAARIASVAVAVRGGRYTMTPKMLLESLAMAAADTERRDHDGTEIYDTRRRMPGMRVEDGPQEEFTV